MEPLNAGHAPGGTPAGDPIPPRGDPADAGTPPRPPWRPARVWASAIVAGLLAGVCSWLIGEATYGRFQPPLLNTTGFPSAEESQANARARTSGKTLEVTLVSGTMGAALGLALGLAGASLRGFGRSAAVAGASGAVLGAVAGAIGAQILMPIYFRIYHPDRDDLLLAIATQGGVAALVGAAGGAAFGLGLGGKGLVGRTLLGGLLGGALGLIAYQIVGVVAFPLDETTKPLSATWATRLLAHLPVATLAAAGSAWGALDTPRRKPAKSAARVDS
ncbi:hypothetical protein [Tautonia plasticadhaerens]|uniref:Uncharacterized protein n=1 Tax=Tautonia plasticadhaerens TaxID=2527974 RepID=A0A518H5M8_9BACT|nr:hypothetical protein [Tautonia plasticadhaerens]QDV36140.1 hypothetical protein ElP_40540 [Tautonia plasticadhaerens]